MGSPDPRHRIAIRVDPDTHQRLLYWSAKKEISVNQYVVEAVLDAIAAENGDYPLPTLEQARLNELIDAMGSLTRSVENLEKVTITGFDSLIGLTRGDNYLLDSDDGEL